jgi:hypothetical protein
MAQTNVYGSKAASQANPYGAAAMPLPYLAGVPRRSQAAKVETHTCGICGDQLPSKMALVGHMRGHKKPLVEQLVNQLQMISLQKELISEQG